MKAMIISHLSGGLGNQMFQYAAGKALALRLNAELKLDISFYELYQTNRHFELNKAFNTEFAITSQSDLHRVIGVKSRLHRHPLLRKIYRKLNFSKDWVIEPHFDFWPGFGQINSSCMLEGNWQSAKYFADFSDEIRTSFSFKEHAHNNHEVLSHIIESNSVSIHIRRGDYTNSQTLAYHGICEADYYTKAIEHLRSKLQKPVFFVFSDDFDAARNMLSQIPNTIFVNNSGETAAYSDMMFMSACKNHIIANSTFSWWGAWLAESPTKIVIAPNNWFAGKQNTKDLYPETWLRM